MLSRFLKKESPDDARSHYRRAPGRTDAISVKLITSAGASVFGVLADLSAGGAAVEFKDEVWSELQLDATRELVFSSLTAAPLRAMAQVRSLPTKEEPTRYGFMFVDTAAVFAQLDEGLYKFFNRRRFRRARPELGESIKGELSFGNVKEHVSVCDVSLGGAGFIVSESIASMLHLDMPVQLVVHVPKTDHLLNHRAVVRHITPGAGSSVRVGVAMEAVAAENESKRQLAKARAALGDYINRRLDEIARYNSSFI